MHAADAGDHAVDEQAAQRAFGQCAVVHSPSAGHAVLDRVHRRVGPGEHRLEDQEHQRPRAAARPQHRVQHDARRCGAGSAGTAPRLGTASASMRRTSRCRSAERARPPARWPRLRARRRPSAEPALEQREQAARGRRLAPRPSRRPGTPSSRDSRVDVDRDAAAAATSTMLSATIIGRPSRFTSSTRRRFRRRLVASTTETISVGRGLAVAPARDTSQRDRFVRARRRQAVGAGQVEHRDAAAVRRRSGLPCARR